MPPFPLAHVQLRFRDEGFDREYETTVVDDPRLKIVRVVRSYDCYGRRERNYYFYEVLGDAEVHVIPDTD